MVRDDFNLPEMIDLDIIFCRNVTIYFNIDTTKTLINKMYDVLADQGYLLSDTARPSGRSATSSRPSTSRTRSYTRKTFPRTRETEKRSALHDHSRAEPRKHLHIKKDEPFHARGRHEGR